MRGKVSNTWEYAGGNWGNDGSRPSHILQRMCERTTWMYTCAKLRNLRLIHDEHVKRYTTTWIHIHYHLSSVIYRCGHIFLLVAFTVIVSGPFSLNINQTAKCCFLEAKLFKHQVQHYENYGSRPHEKMKGSVLLCPCFVAEWPKARLSVSVASNKGEFNQAHNKCIME